MARHSHPLLAGLTFALCSGCTTLGESEAPPQPSYAVKPSPAGAFHEIENAFHEEHGAEASGFLPVLRNEDALRWRLALIDSARVSLDFQYHVWFADTEVGGALLKERAIAAAERGVRVRVLVDDIKLDGLGPELASLDAQSNIEM